MRYLLIGLFFFCFVSGVQAQKIRAGEMSFEFNGEKIILNLSAVDLNKTNLIKCKLRGEKTGDTLIMGNLSFALKKLVVSPDVVAEPSFEFTMMHDLRKQGRSFQFTTAPDGKQATWIEKKQDKAESFTLNTVKQKVNIRKIEFKEGIMTISGDFTAEYESPSSAPMVRKVQITNGKFTLIL